MPDVQIKFEREGVEGIVAVGTYLSDAAKRFGVRFEGECVPMENVHFCQMEIKHGANHLSAETAAENDFNAANGHKKNERLACQAKIEKPGDIVIMTKEKEPVSEEEEKKENEAYRKQFAELPLDKKITELVQLEALALSDTLSYLANSPFTIADKVMGVMAGFGLKMEKNEKDAVRPDEHRANGAENGDASKNTDEKSDESKNVVE